MRQRVVQLRRTPTRSAGSLGITVVHIAWTVVRDSTNTTASDRDARCIPHDTANVSAGVEVVVRSLLDITAMAILPSVVSLVSVSV